jgi:hypothetical protein
MLLLGNPSDILIAVKLAAVKVLRYLKAGRLDCDSNDEVAPSQLNPYGNFGLLWNAQPRPLPNVTTSARNIHDSYYPW